MVRMESLIDKFEGSALYGNMYQFMLGWYHIIV